MKKRWLVFLLLTVIVLTTVMQSVPTARAGVWGPVELINPTCSGVTVRFYYDGLESRDLYIPGQEPDRFRIQVWRRSCHPGVPCESMLVEGWQSVPTAFNTITIPVTWPTQANGSGIEIIVGQINVNNNPDTIVDRDYAGVQLSTFFTCAGGTTPTTTPTTTSALSFNCTGTGVAVMAGGVMQLQAAFAQIAGPLALAGTTGQNQPIAYGNGVSLWALKSNELQAHFDSNPDQTKVVVKSTVCGPIVLQPNAYPTTVSSYAPQAAYTGSGTVHIVTPGENLFRISLKYGRTMAAIAAANGITNYALIYAGQRLIIP